MDFAQRQVDFSKDLMKRFYASALCASWARRGFVLNMDLDINTNIKQLDRTSGYIFGRKEHSLRADIYSHQQSFGSAGGMRMTVELSSGDGDELLDNAEELFTTLLAPVAQKQEVVHNPDSGFGEPQICM